VLTLNELIVEIEHQCSRGQVAFAGKCAAIAQIALNLTSRELLAHLDEAGIIPERFDHDSTEEKLFAKYCDALLARAFQELGMEATLIVERSDSADVIAGFGAYRMVADAKAFRLSRTAKNQKDFKVEALHQWRKGAEYACLVSPLYQYPVSNSQIYQQARAYNVALLSYTHLSFMIRHLPKPRRIRELWDVATTTPAGKSAKLYWAAVGKLVATITGTSAKDWDEAVEAASAHLPHQADQQVAFWEGQKARIAALTLDTARAELIAALKIDSKIAVIRRSVADLQESTETFET
jgi:hypothetical protein